MQKLLKNLEELLGRENLFTNPADMAAFSINPFYGEVQPILSPLAVARPVNVSQMAETLKLCAKAETPMRIRGAGTYPRKASTRKEIIILTTGLSRILEIDPGNRRAIVQGGATCQKLNDEAASAGFFFPPDPQPFGARTIGGAIAENEAGPRSLKYGPVGNHVRNLEICTPDGDRTKFFAQNLVPGSFESGLPPAAMFFGSLGLLGVIAQAEVALLPIIGASRAIIAGFATLAAGVKAAEAIITAGITPCALEVFDEKTATFTGLSDTLAKNLLFMEFDGRDANASIEETRKILGASQVESIRILRPEENEVRDFWNKFNGILPAIRAQAGQFFLEKVACPPSRAASLIEGAQSIAAAAHADCWIFGNPGIACFSILMFAKNGEAAEKAAKDLFLLELILNNALKSEEDLNLAREEWLASRKGGINTTKNLRQIFDPRGLLSE